MWNNVLAWNGLKGTDPPLLRIVSSNSGFPIATPPLEQLCLYISAAVNQTLTHERLSKDWLQRRCVDLRPQCAPKRSASHAPYVTFPIAPSLQAQLDSGIFVAPSAWMPLHLVCAFGAAQREYWSRSQTGQRPSTLYLVVFFAPTPSPLLYVCVCVCVCVSMCACFGRQILVRMRGGPKHVVSP